MSIHTFAADLSDRIPEMARDGKLNNQKLIESLLAEFLHQIKDESREHENEFGGYICQGCGAKRPSNWYVYAAHNPATRDTWKPICAHCIRGGFKRIMGPPWKHMGPFHQK